MLASDDDKEDLARIDELRRKAAAPVPTVTPDGSFGTDEEHTSAADFALERSIGRGAFGEVFLATSKLNGRTYAIKTIPKKQANEERRALLAVKHPFVVRLRWVVHHATDAWLIMDYAPKSTLASHLERRPGRRLPLANARLVSAELASALLALHGAGVVHRDIKPSNVLVDQAGHCLLADLGLAAKTRDPLKRLCGTLEYLAPEQLRGKVYGRSVDLWALGCLTFETLVGYSPFSGARTRAIFQGILRHEPSYFALGDKEAIHLVSGLLKKDVQQRFGMKEDLLGHAYFRSVDRKLLDARRLPAPLGPNALPDVETPDGSKLWTVSSGGSSAPGSRGSSVAAAAPPPQRRNPLDRARYDAASKPRGPPLPPRRNPLLEAASTDDDDDDYAPPVYRRRSGTLFRHAAAGPLLTPTARRRGGRAGRHTITIEVLHRSGELRSDFKGVGDGSDDESDDDGFYKPTAEDKLQSAFWGAHQRFFKELCVAAKVPAVVQHAKLALSQNKCVVIGLLGTGEARADAAREEFGDEFEDFVSAPLATLHQGLEKCPGQSCDFGKRTQRCHCLATNSLLHTICKATKAKKRLGKAVRLDFVRLIETAEPGKPAPPSRVVIKLPRHDYEEIIDALEGGEDAGAESDAGEDYDLAG